MPNLGGFIGNPYMQALFALRSMGEQSDQQNQYTQKVDEQIAQALGLAEQRFPGAMQQYAGQSGSGLNVLQNLRQGIPMGMERDMARVLGQLSAGGQGILGEYGSDLQRMLGGLGGAESRIMGGYGERYRRAEQDLAGYGEQQRQDIERRFENEGGQITQDLINRGLFSSTEGGKQMLGVTERKSQEQRRLAEDLMRNRVGILSGLSGEALGAQERLTGQRAGYEYGGLQSEQAQRWGLQNAQSAYEAAMRGDIRGAQERLGGNVANWYNQDALNRANLYMQGTGDWLNTLMGINYMPPPANNLPYQFGQNAVQPPNAPGTLQTLLPGLVNAGGHIGGAGILAAALGGGGAAYPAFGAFASDKNNKDVGVEITPNSARVFAEAIRRIPIHHWKYKGDATQHVGPMAQDFKECFDLGTDDTTIGLVDAIGVLFAAVKGLAQEIQELRKEAA